MLEIFNGNPAPSEGQRDDIFSDQLGPLEIVSFGDDGAALMDSGVTLGSLQIKSESLDSFAESDAPSAGGSCAHTCNTCPGNHTCQGSCTGSCSYTCNQC